MNTKLLYFAVLFSICTNSSAQDQQQLNGKKTRVTTFKDRLKSESRISDYQLDDKRGTPSYIKFNDNVSYSIKETGELFSKFLPVRKGIDQLTMVQDDAPYGDMEIQRYQQYFKGIKVEHGSYTVTAKNDKVSFMSGEFYALDPGLATKPVFTESAAFDKALQYVHATTYIWQTIDSLMEDGKKPVAELVLVDNPSPELSKGQRLAYKFNIYAVAPLSRAYVYVDAANGEIIFSDAIIKHAASMKLQQLSRQGIDENQATQQSTVAEQPNGFANSTASAATRYTGTRSITTDQVTASSYRLRETARTATANNIGSIVETYNCKTVASYASAADFTDADNNWTAAEFNNAAKDNAALDAHWGAEKVLDYWWNIHGRRSIDNKGFGIKSFVHYKAAYDNAYWNGRMMTYGDGSGTAGGGFDVLTALDVCGHEIGHGLCEFTANLTYQNQSGAMNEGFSDIWGACIENYAISIGDVPAGDNKEPFKIGEEIVASAAQPLRSMINPNSTTTYGPQPDTYLGTFWYTGSLDNGGVHTNSGVLNHWFYVLVQGESGTNDIGSTYNVTGIGWAKAEKIAYVTELNLSANATYANCRTAAINAAITLYGMCSAEHIAVTNAWYAVGVGAVFGSCTATSTVNFALKTDNAFEGSGQVNCTYPSGAISTHTINAEIILSNVSSTTVNTTATITLGGTATLNRDYTISPSSVTWAPNTSGSKIITITIYDDNNSEADETIILGCTVSGGSATVGTINPTETITIADNDTTASTYTYDALLGNLDTYSGLTDDASMFRGNTPVKRIQYFYTAAEMLASGLKPGNISHLFLYIVGKTPARTFTNLNIVLGNTSATNLNSAFATFTTSSTVYSGNYTMPTSENFYDFPLSTPLYWDGVSNIVLQLCYDNASGATDYQTAVSPTSSGNIGTRYITAASGGSLCSTTAGAVTTTNRADIYLGMYNPIQSVKNLSRAAQLGPNADVSFYSAADGKLMARIVNNSSFDYGCTQVEVDRDGTGGTVFWKNGATNLVANKTFRILPTTDNPTGAYTITLYYTKAEHDGWEAATGKDWEAVSKIIKVKGHDISEITPSSTALFTSVEFNTSPTRSTFLSDYQISGTFNTGFSGFGVGDPVLSPVPLKLLSFTGTKNKTASLLNWVTANEVNVDRFEIEVSTDGITYRSIGTVGATGNNSTIDQRYTYTDYLPANGVNYYRLKQLEKTGQYTYSNVVTVEFAFGQYLRINPNPVREILNITVGDPAANTVFSIYGADGRMLYSQPQQNAARSYQLPVNNLPAGAYLLKATIKGQQLVQRFVKE